MTDIPSLFELALISNVIGIAIVLGLVVGLLIWWLT